MSDQGPKGQSGILKGLVRRLTPVVRTCLFVGLIIGCMLGLYSGLGGPKDEAANIVVEKPESRSVPWIIGGSTLLGACIGAAVGLTVEALFKETSKTDQSKPWWKARKTARRKGRS
jgi:hypothetical protein